VSAAAEFPREGGCDCRAVRYRLETARKRHWPAESLARREALLAARSA
jgi:hypothetical protein